MKTQRRHFGALEFINDILLARARLMQAKSDLAVAEARAQTAGGGRKGSKPIASFVQKQVQHARREFTKAETALAKIEKKYLAVIQQTSPAHLPAQAKPPGVVRVIKEKKPAAVLRGIPLNRSAPAALLKKQSSSNPIQPN